nr:ATP synthase subunit 8 [Capitulum mitella]QYF07878.1 ATP synthase F0 subunit 8 [Capitulum mitella]UZN44113.1 ATP synthase F0 subunit 8 [Capitulum mitella]
MPHMAPIMWAFIMIITFVLILIMTSMLFFNNSPLTPSSLPVSKESSKMIWSW